MRILLAWALSSLAVFGTVLSTSCCDRAPETAATMRMQVYEVPAGRADQVRSILRSALGGETPIGRVTTGPGDTVVVVAPEEVHEGVRRLVSQLDKVDSSSEPVQITTSYWMIVGRPLAEAPSNGRGFVVSGDSNLDAVEPALQTIVAAQGPTEFALLERAQITTLNGDRGRAQGRRSIVEQRLADVGGRTIGDLQIQVGSNQLDTRVALDPGKTLVVGQVGFRGATGDAFQTGGSSDMTLYYVMARQP